MTAPITDLNDLRLVKAMAHPLRRRVLVALEGRVASPSELAGELGEKLPNLSYHVRQLVNLGLLREVRQAQRRGAIEHYYTSTIPSLSEDAWADVPDTVKAGMNGQLIADLTTSALAASRVGGFDGGEAIIQNLHLDDRGAAAVTRALERMQRDVAKAAAASRDRGGGVDMRFGLLLFRLPEPPKPAPKPRELPGRDGEVDPDAVLAAIRELEHPTVTSIARRLFKIPKTTQVSRNAGVGAKVTERVEELLAAGRVHEAGQWRSGTTYEVIE